MAEQAGYSLDALKPGKMQRGRTEIFPAKKDDPSLPPAQQFWSQERAHMRSLLRIHIFFNVLASLVHM